MMSRKASIALWIVQGLLAAFFLFVGFMKLTAPAEMLAAQFPLPAEFIRFIGVCEMLGALGLVLPLALKIRPELTSLAALGLTIIMLGAAGTTLAVGGGAMAVMPLLIGVLTALIAWCRRPAQEAAPQPGKGTALGAI
ncbi:MAG: DoxX family protein [Thermomicrobiales bacterium]